mmetsp:Transcript_14542/g.30924  ORF Transcript_14542/g.30924 Transcript_14542/m.30924 type:complete len:139 (-) Transcript_14542:560-976(-)
MENNDWYLKHWLLTVAFLRGTSVMSGYLRPEWLHRAVTSLELSNDDPLARLYARTFAIWTSLSCVVCCVTAFHLDSKPMVTTALASFYVVTTYFAMELGVFGTIGMEKLPPIIVVAGVSIVWLHIHLARLSRERSKQE